MRAGADRAVLRLRDDRVAGAAVGQAVGAHAVAQHVDGDDDDRLDRVVRVQAREGVGEVDRFGVLAVVEVKHRVGAGAAGVVAGWEVDCDFYLLRGEGGRVEVEDFDGGGLCRRFRRCRRGRTGPGGRGKSEAGGKQGGGHGTGGALHGVGATRFVVGAT